MGYEDVELSQSEEASCGFVQNSYGQRVSWKNQLPIQYYIDQSVPEKYRAAITKAAEDWNKSSGKNLIQIQTETTNSSQWAIDGKNIIYWVTTSGAFSTNTLQAKSLLRWTGERMSDVDILVNAVDWTFYLDEADNKRELHLESLMVHEFGHALGLLHQSTYKSVMYMSLGSNVVRNAPYQDPDLKGLGCEYL